MLPLRQVGHRDKGSARCDKYVPCEKKKSEEAGYINDYLCQITELCEANRSPGPWYTCQEDNPPQNLHRGKQCFSKPHPKIFGSMAPNPEEMEKHFEAEVPNKGRLKEVSLDMVTDSGCQSTVVPVKTIYQIYTILCHVK